MTRKIKQSSPKTICDELILLPIDSFQPKVWCQVLSLMTAWVYRIKYVFT
jgi:hypothetical protein